jgi:membrane-bound ClpP family serine protease
MSKKPEHLSEASLEKALLKAAKRGSISANPTMWIATAGEDIKAGQKVTYVPQTGLIILARP